MRKRSSGIAATSVVGVALLAAAACGDGRDSFDTGPSGFETDAQADAGDCPYQCSLDGRSIIRSCTGEVVETCPTEQACGAAQCQEPCAAAAADRSSNGCEFHFPLPATSSGEDRGSCFATFVVNTSTRPVNLALALGGEALDISKATFRTNPGDATLIAHDGAIDPGDSVVVFVSEPDPAMSTGVRSRVGCPTGVVPAVLQGAMRPTGIGSSFQLTANAPVSLVAMYPFGGASSFIPTATLLLPVVTWGTQHLVINPWEPNAGRPTTQIVASEDATEVTIVPKMPIQDGPGVKGTPAKVPATYRLDKGQFLQLVQFDELSGSVVTSNKPTTIFGGHECAFVPTPSGACDALWQQIPAFEQWGSEYVGVGYRPRAGTEDETMPYRIVAARDGTRLDYDPVIPVGAPTEMNAGDVVTFPAGVGDTFVVRTQDADHPVYLAAYMTGYYGQYFGSGHLGGQGDPEFVNVIPAGQWLNSYSFYADPTYRETSLVIVRAKHHDKFEDVWLECAGDLPDFRPIGTRGEYEYTRVDLSRNGGPGQTFGDKTCQTGLQRMRSDGPFTATLWGWAFAASYAYPGGMAHRKLVTTPLAEVR
ncbi:MAG: IgGFc-binding protein [Labilithrix sp.]|nr:IgGFc-binding protein [Labilithrix sp.]